MYFYLWRLHLIRCNCIQLLVLVRPKIILPIIIISQFAGTSLWFAGNAIIDDLIATFGLSKGAVGDLTSAVQMGFIIGTLVFAVLSIADRFSPSKVFFVSAVMGAIFNLAIYFIASEMIYLFIFRGLTGFFLAGIYPVGMKIAADWYEKGLGKALGYLVGALVLGTAFPHILKAFGAAFPWEYLLFATSGLAVIGGLLILLLVPNGPYRKKMLQFKITGTLKIFENKSFKAAAFGYFGHMWELYSFWAFIPLLLHFYETKHPGVSIDLSLWSFAIIGIGGLGSVLGGGLAMKIGSSKVAYFSLMLSGCCCLISPLIFLMNSYVLIGFLLFWGIVVIADSPQFSTMVASTAPKEMKGTALTIVNCIGFAITIISLQGLKLLETQISHQFIYLFLVPGPLIGVIAIHKSIKKLST